MKKSLRIHCVYLQIPLRIRRENRRSAESKHTSVVFLEIILNQQISNSIPLIDQLREATEDSLGNKFNGRIFFGLEIGDLYCTVNKLCMLLYERVRKYCRGE